MKTILVGFDGSERSERALDFAAEEAALRGAELLIVCAWQVPFTVDTVAGFPGECYERLQNDAEMLVDKAKKRAKELFPAVSCRGKAVGGNPAAVLLAEAKQADMVVVGSRGRGGFASLLLGSVAQEVIHHARCPVVVVRSASD